MPSVMSFDELHVLGEQANGQRKIVPVDEYFDEMDLSEDEKEERKGFCRDLWETLDEAMDLVFYYYLYSLGSEQPKKFLIGEMRELVGEIMTVDSETLELIEEYSDIFVDNTFKHIEDENKYYISDDRKMFNAEDMTNAFYGKRDFKQAVENGLKYKQWITMRDERVRDTHQAVDSEIVEIKVPFHVGDSLLMYPKDWSLGASPDEIINCRCIARYF